VSLFYLWTYRGFGLMTLLQYHFLTRPSLDKSVCFVVHSNR
jgi:hypothetical protein